MHVNPDLLLRKETITWNHDDGTSAHRRNDPFSGQRCTYEVRFSFMNTREYEGESVCHDSSIQVRPQCASGRPSDASREAPVKVKTSGGPLRAGRRRVRVASVRSLGFNELNDREGVSMSQIVKCGLIQCSNPINDGTRR